MRIDFARIRFWSFALGLLAVFFLVGMIRALLRLLPLALVLALVLVPTAAHADFANRECLAVVDQAAGTQFSSPASCFNDWLITDTDITLSSAEPCIDSVYLDVTKVFYYWYKDDTGWHKEYLPDGNYSRDDADSFRQRWINPPPYDGQGRPIISLSRSDPLPSECPPPQPPPDPCEDKEPDVDSDNDGICDRCDAYPDDTTLGRYIYRWADYVDKTSGETVAVGYTYHSSRTFDSLTSDQQNESMHTAAAGSADASPDLSNTRAYLDLGLTPIGEMRECVCDQPCTFDGLTGTPYEGDSYEHAGTEAPATGTTGDTVPTETILLPGVADAPGAYGTPSDGDAPPAVDPGTELPGTGSYDGSIAGNSKKTADNTAVIGRTLDSELNELNAKQGQGNKLQAETRDAVEELADALEDGTFNTPSTPAPYEGLPDVDFEGRFDTFVSDMKATPLFSLPSRILQNIPTGDTSVITFDGGIFGSHEFDFASLGSVLTTLKAIFMTVFAYISTRIIILKR